ncbi:hypothetical protein UlMin_027560 [Ulmus minor]
MGGFPSQQKKYDPYAPTFNPRWKDHPNLSYSGNHYVAPNNRTGFNNLRGQQNYQPRQPTPPQNQGKSLEDLITMLTNSTIQFQNDTKSHLKSLENQFSQLATTVGRLEAQGSGKLSSQIVINPKENASAVSLRSGKQLDEAHKKPIKASDEKDLSLERDDATTPKEDNSPRKVSPHSSIPINVPYLPFPSRFSATKKDGHEKEIFETFRKVQVNIPLLDAIKQVPWYAKFLKELCTNKRKLKGNEIVNFGEKVLVVLQRNIPPKCKDPGSFTIPCTIGKVLFERAMQDLGASINVMPSSIFASLNLGPLKETDVIIQLADRSNTYPKGVLEDVLVQVNEMVFPDDFYVIDMCEDANSKAAPLLLSRPFMKTTWTKIDVHNRTLTMEFDGESISFNIFEAMRYPSNIHSCFTIDIIDTLVQEVCEFGRNDTLELLLTRNLEAEDLKKQMRCPIK